MAHGGKSKPAPQAGVVNDASGFQFTPDPRATPVDELSSSDFTLPEAPAAPPRRSASPRPNRRRMIMATAIASARASLKPGPMR